jgi:cytochrome P450
MRDPLWKFNVFSYPYQRKVIKAVKLLREFAEKIILNRVSAVQNGEKTLPDILNHIVTMLNSDASVTLDELVDDFLTFFIAGLSLENQIDSNSCNLHVMHKSCQWEGQLFTKVTPNAS